MLMRWRRRLRFAYNDRRSDVSFSYSGIYYHETHKISAKTDSNTTSAAAVRAIRGACTSELGRRALILESVRRAFDDLQQQAVILRDAARISRDDDAVSGAER